LVIIGGFTLWDIVSYSLEYLLGDRYAYRSSSSPFQGEYAKTRFEKRTSKRFHPFYKTNAGYSLFNPLVYYNDPEIFEALDRYETRLLKVPCRYSSFRLKRILSEMYNNMGLVFDYERVISFAREAFDFEHATPDDWTGEDFS
jgi:hypothetical protein